MAAGQVHPGEQAGRVPGRRHQIAAVQQQASFGQRRDRQTVPRRDHLVVPARADPPVPCGEQGRADGIEAPGIGGFRAPLEDRPAVSRTSRPR